MLNAIGYRVQNFRNVDDSDWIKLDRVTAFVGRNESGKTTLLKALHKFNPATPEPYNPQREFPRDRYTREFKDGGDWPVCSVKFKIENPLAEEIEKLIGQPAPKKAICTRYYDQSLLIQFEPPVQDQPVKPALMTKALKQFAAAARRIPTPVPEQEEATQKLRADLAQWATTWEEKLNAETDLRGKDFLSRLRKESDKYAKPETADMIEALHEAITPLLAESQKASPEDRLFELIESRLPIFIYFENYGILDSAIYLPRFLEDLGRTPEDPRVRTINAMFKHVNLTAQEISDLGREQAETARAHGQAVKPDVIAQDQEKKEARAIKLNSASLDITKRFNDWYLQRRHTIDYYADGDYFRIWIADDRRPGVKIELEGRSKGFQWFFSFYLVFLVESDEGHKDAVLLLDEPGLHLHPTAQQQLISFFERLAEKNQLIYTTHSPFLIDGEHIHRVRPVKEDPTGHSRITAETWPKDRETIFPLQAAAGYAMVRGLFQHKKNVLVEGMSDYYYLHALDHQCRTTNRKALPEDIYITPCGGTRNVGYLASLFLGQEVRPLVLLDGDEGGRIRKDALIKELYAAHLQAILMLDDAVGQSGAQVETEDILGEAMILPALNTLLSKRLTLSVADRQAGSLPRQIEASAKRHGINLPYGWKISTAIHLVSSWAEQKTALPKEVLDRAAMLFAAIEERFKEMG